MYEGSLDPHAWWIGEQCWHCQPCGAPKKTLPPKADLRWGTTTAWSDAARLHGPHSAQGSQSAAVQYCFQHCFQQEWTLLPALCLGLEAPAESVRVCSPSLWEDWGGEAKSHAAASSVLFFLLGSQPGILFSCTELQDLSVTCRWSYLRSLKNGILDD